MVHLYNTIYTKGNQKLFASNQKEEFISLQSVIPLLRAIPEKKCLEGEEGTFFLTQPLLMEQFDTLPIQCRHIEHMHVGVWFRKNNF